MKELWHEVVRLAAQGKSVEDIRRETGYSHKGTVRQILRRAGRSDLVPAKTRSDSQRRKERQQKAVELREAGYSTHEIAKRIPPVGVQRTKPSHGGVSRTRVIQMLRRYMRETGWEDPLGKLQPPLVRPTASRARRGGRAGES